MAFNQLYLRLAIFHCLEDEDFTIHIESLASEVFALNQVETAGDISMPCPAGEVVECFLVPSCIF